MSPNEQAVHDAMRLAARLDDELGKFPPKSLLERELHTLLGVSSDTIRKLARLVPIEVSDH